MKRTVDLLGRKGISHKLTKGTYWHDVDELLFDMWEARTLVLWLQVANVKRIEDLLGKSPGELRLLAKTIWMKYASTEAIYTLRNVPKDDQDEFQIQATMFHRDVLLYIELRSAIRMGDVGRMDDLVGMLLLRFSGSSHPKYTIELMELLQGYECEWPPEVK